MADIEAMKEASIRRVIGPTILLGSGTYFDYEAPETSEITIEDIAYGLAHETRYAGQCVDRQTGRRAFYSVAQHCWLMSFLIPPEHAYAALMHEAGEAVCGDMVGPLKSMLPEYKAIEKRCEAAIQKRFGVVIADADLLKIHDLRMLATERRDLTVWNGESWSNGFGEPFEGVIRPVQPDAAADLFLARFGELAPTEVLMKHGVGRGSL